MKNGPFKRAALPDQSAQILDSAQSVGRVWRRASVAKTLAAEQPGDDGALAEGLKSSFGRSSTQMAPLCLVVRQTSPATTCDKAAWQPCSRFAATGALLHDPTPNY